MPRQIFLISAAHEWADRNAIPQNRRGWSFRTSLQVSPPRESVYCGSEVPEFAFTCEISVALMAPFAFTSRRKFAPVSGWPD